MRRAHDRGNDPLRAALHVGSGAARECKQQDAARVSAVDDKMGHAVGERLGLAATGSGDDEQRTSDVGTVTRNTVLDGPPLLSVETCQMGVFPSWNAPVREPHQT